MILAIFVLSGAAGLIYEVVWARQLVLVFGNTTQAVSAILTGFFGGMAIGAFGGGRLADRLRRPLRLYGLLELILVVVVVVTPVTFRLIHEVYRSAFGPLESAPHALELVRFGLALLALGPATILMGATLPTLTRYLSRDRSPMSRSFGRLYAANTFGAVLGATASGLVLVELLGLTGALVVGAACSGLAGITALALDAWRASREATTDEAAANEPNEPEPMEPAWQEAAAAARHESPDPPSFGLTEPTPTTMPIELPDDPPEAPMLARPKLALFVAFVSGLTSLGYQVLWTRLLASGTGNLTYVFTFILSVFLIGIALGAIVFSIARRWVKGPVLVLGAAQVAIAVLALAGLVLVISNPPDVTYREGAVDVLIGRLAQSVVLVVLPATIVMGFAFPAASGLVGGDADLVGTSAGRLLAVNTVGAIAGTFLVPFFIVPWLGSPHAVVLLAVLNAIAGILVAVVAVGASRIRRAATTLAGLTAVSLLILTAVTGRIPLDPSEARIARAQGTVFASHEDEIASVQAGQIGGLSRLWVTGTSMTLVTVDAKLMPVLPLMLRPASQTALTIAFGMGSAYRAALIAGLTTDAVELVPTVPTMFGWFYPDAAEVLANPHGLVIVADGRNHVELTDKTYDIIVVDPPPPIESAGVSVISSLDFYRSARARLTPGGVMMQWVPFGQTTDELRMHVHSFAAVFSHVMLVNGPGRYGLYMLGSDQPLELRPTDVESILARPGVVADLSSAFDSPAHTAAGWARLIPTLVTKTDAEVTTFAGDAPLITDDRPRSEYFLLRHFFGWRGV